jgi:hypothetical protein
MALNQIAYPVKNARLGVNRILTGTTLNTNTDGSGTLTWVNDISLGTAMTSTDKLQIRKISISLTGNLATATTIRFFISTVTTGNSSSNTWYIGKEILLPVTTLATTTENTATAKTFDLGELILPANCYLCYAVTTAVTNGAVVLVEADDFTA